MSNESEYDKQLKKFLLPMMRKRSLYWWARNEAKKLARVERGLYQCNSCKKIFTGSQINVDHRNPVINVKTSWVSWDHFIKSLFCDVSNLQVLCILCHTAKSSIESELRKKHKKSTKTKK